jgi:cytoskeletal protein CcmA (bactofilin family)
MEQQSKMDLKIFGEGSAAGGSYQAVIIRGQGTIDGAVDCTLLKCQGQADIRGEVSAVYVIVQGESIIGGNLKALEVSIYGHNEVHGSVKTEQVKINGSAGVKGDLTAERVDLKGLLETGGDCNADNFSAKGAFNIGGLLNAGKLEITLYGECRAREIGGSVIRVKKGKAFWFKRFILSLVAAQSLVPGLSAEVIEGDELYLEEIKAKVVRGQNVTLGPGCEIELVEYKNNYQKSNRAKVKEERKI